MMMKSKQVRDTVKSITEKNFNMKFQVSEFSFGSPFYIFFSHYRALILPVTRER